MFMRVASLYDATAFAWGFCRARRHGILVKREWVTNCVVKSSGFLVVFVFLFTDLKTYFSKFELFSSNNFSFQRYTEYCIAQRACDVGLICHQ